jgi:CYTH domain-containing protein
MNPYLLEAKRAIATHGISLTYKSVANGTYSTATKTTTKTTTNYTVKMYPKQIKANQYNYPTLVGKEVVMFYLVNDSLGFTVKVADSITYNGSDYKIDSFQTHVAQGQLVLYRIVAVKG